MKMINTNEQMRAKLKNDSELFLFAKNIVSKTTLIKECIIYDKTGKIKESEVNFEKIIELSGDRTGYEVECSEIRIDKNFLPTNQIANFLLILSIEFLRKYHRKMVFYIQEIDGSFDLRFHSLWENEEMWLLEDLNEYDVPIMRYITE